MPTQVQTLNMLYVAHLCMTHSTKSVLTCGSLINFVVNSYNIYIIVRKDTSEAFTTKTRGSTWLHADSEPV